MDLGNFIMLPTIKNITRQDGTANNKLLLYFHESLNDSDLRMTKLAVKDTIQNFDFPSGYGPPKNESDIRIEEMQQKGDFIIYFSVLLIYLTLASIFESFLIPLAILFTIPLAILFGIAGLLVFGMDLDVMARLSLIILVGSAVNGSIILIDLIQELRRKGYRREEALIQSCVRRFGAVIMSAAIQVLGILPVAMGKAKLMGIPYASLGVSMISGITFSTIMTLILLPLIYELMDRVENRLKTTFGLNRVSKPSPHPVC